MGVEGVMGVLRGGWMDAGVGWMVATGVNGEVDHEQVTGGQKPSLLGFCHSGFLRC